MDCVRCGADFTGTLCPNCGLIVTARDERGPIRWYFETVWEILTRPSAFFSRMPASIGVAVPLAFALVTHWIGSTLAFLWRLAIGGAMGPYFDQFFKVAGDVAEVDYPGRAVQLMEMRDRIVHWMWGAGSVIIDPFLTLISILFTSFLVYLGARILVTPGKNGAPSEVTYDSALRIVCFGMTPAILAGLPIFGGFISAICVVIVTVIGAREVYRIPTGRAIVVALFPKLLFLGIILMGLMLFAIVLLKLFASLI